MDEKKLKTRRKILLALTCFCGVISILLGFLIYAKKDQNGKYLKNNFDIDCNFETLNGNVDKIIDGLFSFGITTKDSKTTPVASSINYLYIGNNLYKTNDNQVRTINSGIVLGIYHENDGTDTIIVSYDNGVLASYFSIENTKVKTYDQLKKGDVIGGVENEFKVLFKKGDSLISFDEANS